MTDTSCTLCNGDRVLYARTCECVERENAALDAHRDTKPSNVVSLADERIKRIEGAAEEAHARGVTYSLKRYGFDDRSIGYDPDPGDPSTEVCLVINGRMEGITMSAEDAIRLGEALVHAGRTAPSRRGQ